MDTKRFLDLVLGHEGFYCAFGFKPAEAKRVQKFYGSKDSVIAAAANLNIEGYDAYFALATFQDGKSRKATNVLQLKSLFLDIDCGPGKPYADKESAIYALAGFVERYDLPEPTAIVNSGRGLHVYWGLIEPLSRDTWVGMAHRLESACRQYGLMVDHSVTTDAARILRVPGTHNYKAFPPLDVTILQGSEQLTDAVSFYDRLPEAAAPIVLPKVTITSTDEEAGSTVEDRLAGGYEKKFTRIAVKSLKDKGCGQIKRALTNSPDLSYDQWLDVLSIAKHCDDHAEAIHKVSAGYPEYSVSETDRIATSLQYPHLCSTFDRHSPGICSLCPLRSKIKSPITLALEIQEATDNTAVVGDRTYEIPKYPTPYFRGANGGVYLRSRDDGGDPVEIQVYRDDFYIVKRLYDPTQGPTYVFRLHTPREGVKEFTIAAVKLSSKDDFRKEMGMHDIFLLKVEMLMQYVATWIHQLQMNTDQISAKVQFGWTDSEKFQSFVIGDKEYFADRIEDNPPSGATAQHFPAFVPKGTIEGWKQTIQFYDRPGFEVHQYMLGTAFGSPLMAFTPIPGAIFHVHSPKSGFGKTTGMFAGASVWGSHQRLVLKAKDTFNSQWLRAEVYKNLPMYIDELTNVEPKELSQFAYNVTDGQQKNRMMNSAMNSERVRGEPWNLIVGTTANVSLLERMNLYKHIPHGEAQRVLESRVEKQFFTPEEKMMTDQLSGDLLNNYGHAGPLYIQHILNNIEGTKRLIKQVQNRLDQAADLSSENRIWSAQGACVISGLIIAKKLGLVTFDIEALFAWLVGLLSQAKKSVQDMDTSATDIISQYYAENFHNVLRIKSTDDARRGTGDTGLDIFVVPDAIPRGQWTMRHEYDVGRLFIMTKPLKLWCNKQQINYQWLVDAVKNGSLKGVREKVRMGRGTRVNMPPMDVLTVHWDTEKDESVQSIRETMDLARVEDTPAI